MMLNLSNAPLSYLNRDYSVLQQNGRHAIVSYFQTDDTIVWCLVFIMFDTSMFLLSFDTDWAQSPSPTVPDPET